MCQRSVAWVFSSGSNLLWFIVLLPSNVLNIGYPVGCVSANFPLKEYKQWQQPLCCSVVSTLSAMIHIMFHYLTSVSQQLAVFLSALVKNNSFLQSKVWNTKKSKMYLLLPKVFWIELILLRFFKVPEDNQCWCSEKSGLWRQCLFCKSLSGFELPVVICMKVLRGHVMWNKWTAKQQMNFYFECIQPIEQKSRRKLVLKGQEDQDERWIPEMGERYLDNRAEPGRSWA